MARKTKEQLKRSKAAEKGWVTRKQNQSLEGFETEIQKRAAKIEKMIEDQDRKDEIFQNGKEGLSKVYQPGFWGRLKIQAKESRDRRHDWAMKNWKYKVIRIEKDMGIITFMALMVTEMVLLLLIMWVMVMSKAGWI